MHRLDQFIARTIANIRESVLIHGDWRTYTPEEIGGVVSAEFLEYHQALEAGVVHGDHGQIDELIDLATVAIKGAIQLERLEPAASD